MKKTNTLASILSFVIAILVSSNVNSAAGAPFAGALAVYAPAFGTVKATSAEE